MFAVIETGGKQYKVSPNDVIRVEKLETGEGEVCTFENVLLVDNGKSVMIGEPYLKGARVEAKVRAQARDDKKIVFKYHSKARYRKLKGHRQHYTEVQITSINA